MLGIRISTLRWCVGVLAALIGAMMLIVPQQFSAPFYAALQPQLFLWGAVFVLAGAALLVLAVSYLSRAVEVAIHLLAGAGFIVLAYGLALAGGWTGAASLGTLGIGTALAPFLSRGAQGSRPAPWARSDLFVMVVGLAMVLAGLTVVALPGQFSAPAYDFLRPYLPLFGLAFLLGGPAAFYGQLRKTRLPRAAYWAAHLAAGGALLAVAASLSLPLRAWIGIAYYGGSGAVLLTFPWAERRLGRVDSHSLQTQLAVALGLAAALPLVLAAVLVDAVVGLRPAPGAAGLQAAREVTFFILLAVTAIAALAGALVARLLAGQLDALAQAAARMASGDMAAPLPPGGSAETQRLALALREMRDRLDERTAERERLLQEVERRAAELEATIRAISDGLIIYGPEGQITYMNQAAEAILGFTAAEWAAMSPEERFAHLQTRTPEGQPVPPPSSARSRALRGEVVAGYEEAIHRRDGTVRQILVSAGPILDAQGRIAGAIMIFSDITPLHELQQERARLLAQVEEALASERRARQRAEEAVQARDRFLDAAAHELKTPVTNLRGYAELTLRQLGRGQAPEPQELTRRLGVIDREAARLARLVNQLLDVAALETGQVRLQREQVDAAALLRQAVASAQAGTRRHTLALSAPAALPASVDPARFEQVVRGLLDNAIKFSPEGTSIEVELVASAPGLMCLAVRDHGPGIPPERRAQLFSRFYQAQTGRPFSGLGLGLYAARRLVELHGGEIRAEFPPDGGTRFVVTLPTEGTGH